MIVYCILCQEEIDVLSLGVGAPEQTARQDAISLSNAQHQDATQHHPAS